MKKKTILYPLGIGLFAFSLTFLLTSFIVSPHPFWASVIVGFIIFEISYYHFFKRKKEKMYTERLYRREKNII